MLQAISDPTRHISHNMWSPQLFPNVPKEKQDKKCSGNRNSIFPLILTAGMQSSFHQGRTDIDDTLHDEIQNPCCYEYG